MLDLRSARPGLGFGPAWGEPRQRARPMRQVVPVGRFGVNLLVANYRELIIYLLGYAHLRMRYELARGTARQKTLQGRGEPVEFGSPLAPGVVVDPQRGPIGMLPADEKGRGIGVAAVVAEDGGNGPLRLGRGAAA